MILEEVLGNVFWSMISDEDFWRMILYEYFGGGFWRMILGDYFEGGVCRMIFEGASGG